MTSNIDKVMASRCRLGGYYLVANVVWLSRGWIHTTCPFSSLYLPEFACIGWTVQGKYWSMGSEDTHAGMTFREQEDRLSACCVCGCEDNEFFEPLVGFIPDFSSMSIKLYFDSDCPIAGSGQ